MNTIRYSKLMLGLVLLTSCSIVLQAAAPTGWFLAGSKPAAYETGTDAQVAYNGHPSAYLKAKQPAIDGFGTLMQEFRATKYLGQRVRLSAYVKSEGVQDWAGLWMRVDRETKPVSFDNMEDRPIKGTTGWQRYEVVLDVPQNAAGVAFGVLLGGPGTIWLNSVKLETVGTDVPITGKKGPAMRDEAINLNFEER